MRGKTISTRSNIYAVGRVFLGAVTGIPPLTGEIPLSVVYQHVQDQPPRPLGKLSTDPNAAQALDAVLLTTMAKNPVECYGLAGDFAQGLRRFAHGEDPLALTYHGAHNDNTRATEFLPAAPPDTAARTTPAQ